MSIVNDPEHWGPEKVNREAELSVEIADQFIELLDGYDISTATAALAQALAWVVCTTPSTKGHSLLKDMGDPLYAAALASFSNRMEEQHKALDVAILGTRRELLKKPNARGVQDLYKEILCRKRTK